MDCIECFPAAVTAVTSVQAASSHHFRGGAWELQAPGMRGRCGGLCAGRTLAECMGEARKGNAFLASPFHRCFT